MKINNRKIIANVFFATLFILGISSLKGVNAKENFRFSCSAQIAEAYGKGIKAEFTNLTGIHVNLYIGSSETALNRLVNGISSLAAITHRLPNVYRENGYIEIPFCKDSLTIITHKTCSVNNISNKELQGIFRGHITNWKELGGIDQKIIVIVPSKNTDAYKNFSQLVMINKEIEFDFMTYKSTLAIEGVKYLPGAVSFIAQGAIANEDSLKTLNINNISPKDKSYPYHQIFSFITRGKPSGAAKEIIDFSISEKGLNFIKKRGMYPVIK